MEDALYSNAVLQLAADIPRIGALADPDASVRKVARLCGSEIELDLTLEDDRIADLALRIKACALGQAAASVLARNAVGASVSEIFTARDELRAMLKSDASAPQGRFAELSALEGVRDYPARHQSVMLAFNAAADALEMATTTTRLTG